MAKPYRMSYLPRITWQTFTESAVSPGHMTQLLIKSTAPRNSSYLLLGSRNPGCSWPTLRILVFSRLCGRPAGLYFRTSFCHSSSKAWASPIQKDKYLGFYASLAVGHHTLQAVEPSDRGGCFCSCLLVCFSPIDHLVMVVWAFT